jgi:hypothetical protein
VFGRILGKADRPVTEKEEIPITMEEFKGISCLTVGGGIGLMTVVFGGTAIAAFGSPGAGTTAIAIPALATAMWAGCAFGSAAAPGLAWAARYSESLLLFLAEITGDVVRTTASATRVGSGPSKSETSNPDTP